MADIVRETGMRYRNWGKWGPDDELGTLNYITPEMIVKATRSVKRGTVFSLSLSLRREKENSHRRLQSCLRSPLYR